MLQLSASLLNRPILSLQTGGIVGTALQPIINPNNLKIEGFYCADALDRKRTAILLYQDIRDIIMQGIVVNDHDVLVNPQELIRLKNIMNTNFELLGKKVITTSKQKLGKVVDYATDLESMYIQKLYLSQSMLKSLTSGNVGVDRTQIVEITDKQIIIHDIAQRVPARVGAPA